MMTTTNMDNLLYIPTFYIYSYNFRVCVDMMF